MRYTVTRQLIQVVGTLWMPGTTAAMQYTLSAYDMDNLGDPRNREDVENWLGSHAGDFAQITDFRADFTIEDQSVVHEWANEENEMTFNDCMYPSED